MSFLESSLAATQKLTNVYKQRINEPFVGKEKHSVEWNGKKLTLTLNKDEAFRHKLASMGIHEIWLDCIYEVEGKEWTLAKLTLENASFDEMDSFQAMLNTLGIKISVSGKNLKSNGPVTLTQDDTKKKNLNLQITDSKFTGVDADLKREVMYENINLKSSDDTHNFPNFFGVHRNPPELPMVLDGKKVGTATIDKYRVEKLNFKKLFNVPSHHLYTPMTPYELCQYREHFDAQPLTLISDLFNKVN